MAEVSIHLNHPFTFLSGICIGLAMGLYLGRLKERAKYYYAR